MRMRSKALLLVLCAVLLAASTVFGTLAYLTDTEAVTNTFTVGNVGLKLDEAKVKEDGTYVTDATNRGNGNKYHLLPGHTYVKDPTVTVDAKSSDAYVRMIVTVKNYEKLLAALPDAKYYGEKNIFLLQMLCNDWDANTWIFEGAEDGVYEFRYKEVVAESETATTLPPLFKSITVPGEIDNDHLANLKDVEIIVTAHAMQADGFEDDADAAWAAFDGQNG